MFYTYTFNSEVPFDTKITNYIQPMKTEVQRDDKTTKRAYSWVSEASSK